MSGNTIDKTEDQEFTFQVAELDVYQVEAIAAFGSQTSGDHMNALMSEAIKRQLTL
jgi:hypothetical protein